MDIRLLLFDLGGVLYNIEHARTRNALKTASLNPECNIGFSLEVADPIFARYDAGKITTNEFVRSLQHDYALQGSDEDVLNAWNAMLLGLYPDALSLISSLRDTIPIALLSNINPCHHQCIADECSLLFAKFHHVFLSYELSMKKPDPEIFRFVMDQTGYEADTILFLDDTPKNCESAQSLGMHVRLIDPLARDWVQDITSQFL